jgi:hypothetical protein
MSEQIQAGTYKGRAVAGSAQYGHTSNGNEQIALDLSVPALGRTLTTFLYFSDAAAPWSLERLKACGWAGDNVTDLAGIDKNEIDIQVKYEEWNGQPKLRVEILTGSGGKVQLADQMDDKTKRAFGARMSQFMKGIGSKPADPKATGAKMPFDDDFPVD